MRIYIVYFYVSYLTGVCLPSPPSLLQQYFYAIITVESNWYVRALSRTGDIGLAQINPFGALKEYNNYHKHKVSVKDLYNSDINLMVGKWYFEHLHKIFKGDFNKSIAAYNMGPGKIRNGMKNTRYVLKVKRNLGKPVNSEHVKRQ